MNYDSNLIRFFILAPVVPECLILYLVFQRKLHREISWFAVYLLLDATSALLMFHLYQTKEPWQYFVGSWLQGVVIFTLAFMVIAETFRNVLAGYPTIKKLGAQLLFGAGMALLVVAILSGHLGAQHSNNIMRMLLVLKRSIMMIQVGLVVVLFAFSSYLGLSWKHYQFGITLGYGLYASTTLATMAYVAQVGVNAAYATMIIEQVAYQSAVLLWAVYFIMPPERPLPPTDWKRQPELERWNEALSELLSR